MPTHFDDATVERARVLVETSARTLEDIAVEIGASVQTLRNWTQKRGWRRHPQAPRAVPKLPPEKQGPARRIYEGGAGVGDLAALLGCHESYVHRLAKQRGWLRAWAAEVGLQPPNPALLAIAEELRDRALARRDIIRPLERALAHTLIDAIEKPDVGCDRRAELLAKILKLLRSSREDAPPDAGTHYASPENEERERQELIEQLARRIEAMAEEPADSPIAATTATAA